MSDLPSPHSLAVPFRPLAAAVPFPARPCGLHLLPSAGMGLLYTRVCGSRADKSQLCWRNSQDGD